MKYTININQKAVIDNGWNLGLNHLAVLDVITSCINSGKFEQITSDGKTFYWIKISKIIEECPILQIKERRCIMLINDLVSSGLLERHKNNQNLARHFIRFGLEFTKLHFAENCTPMQNIADLPMQNIAEVTMQKIAYNNNTNYNNTNDNEERKTPTAFPNLVKQNIKLNQEVKVLDVINEMGADEVFIQHVQYETKKRTQRIVSPEKVKERLKEFYSHKLKTKGEEYDTRKNIRQHFLNWIVKQ